MTRIYLLRTDRQQDGQKDIQRLNILSASPLEERGGGVFQWFLITYFCIIFSNCSIRYWKITWWDVLKNRFVVLSQTKRLGNVNIFLFFRPLLNCITGMVMILIKISFFNFNVSMLQYGISNSQPKFERQSFGYKWDIYLAILCFFNRAVTVIFG